MAFSVCVFCGSRRGADPAYQRDALTLGRLIGEAGWRLVYGGGDVGLMGDVAGAVMAAGGTVLGVIPERLLEREVGKTDITELVVSKGMADRKELMISASDAFVALPGGLGTLDELLEVMTLKQLGYHTAPILMIDTAGYWSATARLVEEVIAAGFADPGAMALAEVVATPHAAIERLSEPHRPS